MPRDYHHLSCCIYHCLASALTIGGRIHHLILFDAVAPVASARRFVNTSVPLSGGMGQNFRQVELGLKNRLVGV